MKNSTTLVQQAKNVVIGFAQSYEKFENWMLSRQKSVKSISNYGRKIGSISLHFRLTPEQLTSEQINAYLSLMRKKSPSLSLSEFKHMVYGLRNYYKSLGIKKESIELPPIKHESKLPVILNRQECQKLFVAPSLLKHRVLLAFVYSAGLRVSELQNIKLSDIDSQRMLIHIRGSKYNKDRYVPLSAYILKGLRQYVQICHPQIYLFNGSLEGSRMSSKGIGWIMREAKRKSGILKEATLHTLRHSYATHLLEMGLDIVRVKELMGHTDIRTTMIYMHVINPLPQQAFSPLDKLYSLET